MTQSTQPKSPTNTIAESSELIRLTLADLVRKCGIPRQVLFDNGRGFAAKWLTGGTPNRFRFRVPA